MNGSTFLSVERKRIDEIPISPKTTFIRVGSHRIICQIHIEMRFFLLENYPLKFKRGRENEVLPDSLDWLKNLKGKFDKRRKIQS